MKRLTLTVLASLLALATPAPAQGAAGLQQFDVAFTGADGSAALAAGQHPFAMTTSLEVNTVPVPGGEAPEEMVKDLDIAQVPGFAGVPGAVPRCSTADFLTQIVNSNASGCPDSTALGLAEVTIGIAGVKGEQLAPLYNLQPPPGKVAKLGFWVLTVPVTVDVGLSEEPPYRVVAESHRISQVLEFFGAEVTLWGNPADPVHDPDRGSCYNTSQSCPAGIEPVPFLTTPRACAGPLASDWALASWQSPASWVSGFALTHDDASPPNPQGMSGCGQLDFAPEAAAVPSTRAAESASGLDVSIDVADEGLMNPKCTADADISGVELRLPAGMTLNPSAAEGLGVCTPAQYAAERLASRGCPDASRLGTVEVKSPLLEDLPLRGHLYLAQQDDPATAAPGAENPFDSLAAAYLVIRDPELGIFVKQAGEVSTDERSGQVVSSFEGLPPFPLSEVDVSLRGGPRAPFVTPPACGAYSAEIVLTPSSGQPPLAQASSFEVDSGPGGKPCPAGGVPPFEPGFEAGSENNAAAAYTPFSMRLTRADGEQGLTKFSAVLPPGMTGKLAGLGKCPDGQIAAARAKSGRAEQAAPSCPAASQVGSVIAGAGVGTALTYVGGKLYLAGPHNGAPLSVAAIVPAVAGPFDVGTVVTRVALRLNPRSAQVEVDGSRSDPIPHILEGIPLKVRDVRVLTDRPGFTLNPTSCDPSQTTAEIFGSFADPFSPADDAAVARDARFQASSCASLGFKPRLELRLRGGTRRGQHPALTGTYAPRPGDANLAGLVLRLPSSAFLEQAHIRTICTRVQFAAKACPAGAIYGRARAWTPLLEEPLEGPVYLRASSNPLPDFVADLHGIVDIEAVARIDSKNGGIRATFLDAPDAPLSKVVVQMRGGKKGLIVNSANLCARTQRANATFTAHSGKRVSGRPAVVAAGCKKRRGTKGQGSARTGR